MIGAVAGDVIGSVYEFVFDVHRPKDFPLFSPRCRPTDDSYMTFAVAKALVESGGDKEKLRQIIVGCMKEVAYAHPNAGWGERFAKWLSEKGESRPYNSFGNGAGMRISPVGWVADSEDEVKELSRIVTEVSHNHPEGLKGAEAVAVAVFLARTGKDKEEIRETLSKYYPRLKDKDFTIQNIYEKYGYDDMGMWITCQGSVPQALVAFLDGNDFEDCIRNAVYIGGDSDTLAAMAGSVAEAYYGIPDEIKDKVMTYLSDDVIAIYNDFEKIKKPRVPRKE